MQSTISVLIPTYNQADLLAETLESVLSQTYPAAEVIVLDDGSVDHTRHAVARFGARVTYRYTPNGGICKARNIAASLATSTYLAFCDHDDLWRSDKLEQQMRLHDRDPRIEYSFTNFSIVSNGVWAQKTEFDHAPDRSFPPYSLSETGPVVLEEPFYDQILHFQPVRPSTVVISRRLFEKIGRFEESFGKNPSEDVEFTLRCMQHPPIGIVREPVVGIRTHRLNYSGDEYRNLRGQMEVFFHALEHHTINDQTRRLILREIELRRVDASYHAFRKGDFEDFRSLIGALPSTLLNSKSKLKLLIARMPPPVALAARRLLMKA